MNQKNAVRRIMAVLISTFIILSCVCPVFAVKAEGEGEEETASGGGIFSESWFKGWEDIYNLSPEFGDMAEAGRFNENISGTEAEKDMIYACQDIIPGFQDAYSRYLVNNPVTANFAASAAVFIAGSDYDWTDFAHDTTHTGLEKALIFSALYKNGNGNGLDDIIRKVNSMIRNLNHTDQAVRASSVLALNTYLEDDVRNNMFSNVGISRVKNEMQNSLDEVADFVISYGTWLGTKDADIASLPAGVWETLENSFDEDALDNIHFPTRNGSYALSLKRHLVRAASDPDLFRRVFKEQINKRLDYLQMVYEASVSDYNSVPEEFWSSVSADTEGPGLIEKKLSELVVNVSTKINKMLNSQTIRFENIVYGRVKTNGGIGLSVNNFSFELEENNVYAITGSGIYVIMRGLVIIGVMVFLMYYLAKESMVTSARERSKIKSNIGFVLLAMFLMYAMPNLVDAMIHIRDALLYEISQAVGDSAFDSMYSLAENFKKLASKSKELVDSFQYLGMVIITIYLAFVYIGMACSMTIMFALFPLFVIFSFRDHKILNEWVTFVLGVITTPIIDAVLFILPLLAARTNTVTDLIKLILCLSIIPARGMVRRMLGFSTSAGAELVGLGAIMAGGRAIGAMARTARNTVTTVATGVSSAASDLGNARLHQRLGRAGASDSVDFSSLGSEASDSSSPLSGTISELGGGPRGGGSGGGAFGGLTDTQRRVLNSSANINNFEQNGILNNLDHDTAATLYKKRAARTVAQTMFKTAGTVQGGLAGGALGLGASTFLGSNAAMMLGSGGMAMGAEVGGAAGQVAGTAVSAGLRGASSGAYAAYNNYTSGVTPSMMSAAMMGSYGDLVGGRPIEEAEIVRDEDGNPILDVNGDYVYKGQKELGVPLFTDVSQALGGNRSAVMTNLINNQDAYADTVNNNIQRILNSKGDLGDMESALINEFTNYGYVGASLLSDNPLESLDRAYIPNNPSVDNAAFRAMSDAIYNCSEARVDVNGKVWFPGAQGAPENFDKLPLAFKGINAGYHMPSYEDKKNGNSFTPQQGYIGRGMVENMKANMPSAIKKTEAKPNYGEGVKKSGEAGAETFKPYDRPAEKTQSQVNDDMSRINSFLNA